MYKKISSNQNINYLQELIDLNFSSKDNAYFNKKIAEIHLNEGNYDQAVCFLKQAISLDSQLEGVKLLKKRLKTPEIEVIL